VEEERAASSEICEGSRFWGGGGESSEQRDVGEEREVETRESWREGVFERGGCEKDGEIVL